MSQSSGGHLLFEKDGPIATVTLNRPEKLNAWSPELEEGLFGAFKDCQADDSIRAVILTGAGDRAFSSGEDVAVLGRSNERRNQAGPGPASVRSIRPPEPASFYIPRTYQVLEKPVIAAVNGIAAGGGYGLALGADIRIASENATFVHVYPRRGLVASAEVWYLPRLIGVGPALFHLLLADEISADEALKLGLVSKVVPREQLMPEAMVLAQRLADGPAMALRLTKRAVWQGLRSTVNETLDFVGWARTVAGPSGEASEGVRAFLEKRKPDFRPK